MIIQTQDLKRFFQVGSEQVKALDGINLSVEKGEFLSIMGPSGSGKTTLMNIIGCLDTPTHGTYLLNNKLVNDLDSDELAGIRNKEIGFVFQSFHLLAKNSALNNVMLPLKYAGVKEDEAIIKAKNVLDKVGLTNRIDHTPSELSGGQQQRVAIARAMCLQPEVLLLDEPTAALDPEMSFEVLETIKSLAEEGVTMIYVTHEINLARHLADQVIFIEEGRVVAQGDVKEVLDTTKNNRIKKFIEQIEHRLYGSE